MTGSRKSAPFLGRPGRLAMGAQLIWLFLVFLLGAWWTSLLLKQAHRIAELEGHSEYWNKTQHMLYWESASFFGLLLGCSVLLFWLYWRDLKRAKALHAFFASVTHELRTPLTSIRLQAESIADTVLENNPDPSAKVLLQRLLEDSVRLETQVERTLELARIEGGGPVYRQPLEIRRWLERFRDRFVESSLVDFDLSGVNDEVIEADLTAIQIIFKNLLENTLRHSKQAKLIKQDKLKIKLDTQVERNHIVLNISDNGGDYSDSDIQLGRLFEKGSASQGAGVGLYLIKTLMKRMGGSAFFQGSALGFEVKLSFPVGKFEDFAEESEFERAHG